MKHSKYIIPYKEQDELYIYHQISESLLKVDESLYNTLLEDKITDLPEEFQVILKEKGFIIPQKMDESIFIKYGNLKTRYQGDILRVTILPTLNCNFKCWYCYEQHYPSKLSEEGIIAIKTFIINEAIQKKIKRIELDWFGGEPLLYFDKIIFPISIEIKEWAKENEVQFVNMITTNGSLITQERISLMNNINLRSFQITFDGDKEYHNKVRFSPKLVNSFDVILNNIHTLCRGIYDINMDVRINYTMENINSIETLLDRFDKDIRKFISISMHIVWQESEKIIDLSPKVQKIKKLASNMGFKIPAIKSFNRKCTTCYTENTEQFVINHDLNVYKCTARDFTGDFSIGKILDNGSFMPNSLYFKYYTTSSPVLNDNCIQCDLLPSCLNSGSCLQKKIEGAETKCFYKLIQKEVLNMVKRKIQQKPSSTQK